MREGIIDFHTHAFPDSLAERAVPALEEEGGIKACLDGKVASLLASMDRNGIEKSIVCSIATKPSQFEPILRWSKEIKSDRIIPFPSFHPDDSDYRDRISIIKGEGFKGIKFHPYYQEFDIDEERMFPIYEKVLEENLILTVHTGFDFAFPRIPRADPEKIAKVMDVFPGLKLVTTHLGSWDQWPEVEEHLMGNPVYMEISFSLEYLSRDVAKRIILSHPREYILFGTDSPWTDQGSALMLFRELGLGEELEKSILRQNALSLIGSVS